MAIWTRAKGAALFRRSLARSAPSWAPMVLVGLLLGAGAGDGAELSSSNPGGTPVVGVEIRAAVPAQPSFAGLPGGAGWQFLYASGVGAGARSLGQLRALQEQVRRARGEVGVIFPVFHGNLSARCQQLRTDEGGTVHCSVQVSCTRGGFELVPDVHSHEVQLSSDGSFDHVVTTRNDRNEARIVAMEHSRATIAWYGR